MSRGASGMGRRMNFRNARRTRDRMAASDTATVCGECGFRHASDPMYCLRCGAAIER